MTNEDYYSTSDLALVSILSLTQNIRKSEKEPSGRFVFYFENTPQLKKMVENFWGKKLRVEPQQYFGQIRQVKNLIYGQGKNKR